MNYRYITETLMDNEHMKLFVIKQSKGCKFMPKMHENIFGGQALPGPTGGAYALSQTRSCNGGPTCNGRKRRGGS